MGRAQAEARMTETVRIGWLDEGTDPVTLDPIQTLDVVYDGRARVKFPSMNEVEVDAGGQLIVKQDAELHLPSGTTGVTPDMRAVVDASTADAALVGRVFRVKGRPTAGQTTASRYACEETGETITAEGS
jgi:hypothetical protein